MARLTAELKPGDAMQIGAATVTLEEKKGQRARLVISAPPEVKIERVKKP